MFTQVFLPYICPSLFSLLQKIEASLLLFHNGLCIQGIWCRESHFYLRHVILLQIEIATQFMIRLLGTHSEGIPCTFMSKGLGSIPG